MTPAAIEPATYVVLLDDAAGRPKIAYRGRDPDDVLAAAKLLAEQGAVGVRVDIIARDEDSET